MKDNDNIKKLKRISPSHIFTSNLAHLKSDITSNITSKRPIETDRPSYPPRNCIPHS